MKTILNHFTLLIIISTILTSCQNPIFNGSDNKVETLDEAIELTKSIWQKHYVVYALQNTIAPHSKLIIDKYDEPIETITTPNQECWVIFIHHLNINLLMHSYTWLLVNKETGKIKEISASCPPMIDSSIPIEEQQKSWIFIKSTRMTPQSEQVIPSKKKICNDEGKK